MLSKKHECAKSQYTQTFNFVRIKIDLKVCQATIQIMQYKIPGCVIFQTSDISLIPNKLLAKRRKYNFELMMVVFLSTLGSFANTVTVVSSVHSWLLLLVWKWMIWS